MKTSVKLLDCTLRDGAYINGGAFGSPGIMGIIKKLSSANVEVIECGWLKNDAYSNGSSYYHVPQDLTQYLPKKSSDKTYVVMIDWDRYDVSQLPECDGNSIDAIRVVFPHGKHREGIAVAKRICEKGYQVYLQAANTLSYCDKELADLARYVNHLSPVALSVVDTFGAMFSDDLDRIIGILDRELDGSITLGFHSHNNMQLSFALSIHFVNALFGKRNVMLDASLCGMGRGAGNAPTELVTHFLNSKYHKNYDMNAVFDAIDTYMSGYQEQYKWGYSTPYCIAGMYQCHVNNIAYLLKNHRTNSRDMHNILDSMTAEQRRHYDYDLLETKYRENQGIKVDDEQSILRLKEEFGERPVLLIGPGNTTNTEYDRVKQYIDEKAPVVIFINALNPRYEGDYLFLISSTRYYYAMETYKEQFHSVRKILLSNIKSESSENEIVIDFNSVIKHGWEHFDNAIITCLRLMSRLSVKEVAVAGFDEFRQKYNETYADKSLPTVSATDDYAALNAEIQDMIDDFVTVVDDRMNIVFVTNTAFDPKFREIQ